MARAILPDDDDRAADLALKGLRRQLRFWLVATVFFAGFIYLFSDILLPFVAGMVLAYFLDPVADWLQRRGVSRLIGDDPHPRRLRRHLRAVADHPDPGAGRPGYRRLHRPAARLSRPAPGA